MLKCVHKADMFTCCSLSMLYAWQMLTQSKHAIGEALSDILGNRFSLMKRLFLFYLPSLPTNHWLDGFAMFDYGKN